jgi:hypothetical protein|tara:strand:+ start:1667 stop:1999 length:333 start_codon:yes stop_codon:yes gene_type:complete
LELFETWCVREGKAQIKQGVKMRLHGKIWQKGYEASDWIKEELVYFNKSKNIWVTEVYKYFKDEDGEIIEVECLSDNNYPRGSKDKLETLFPWLKKRPTWVNNYKSVKNY